MLPDPDKVYSRSDNGSGEKEDGDDESNEDDESEDERYDEN